MSKGAERAHIAPTKWKCFRMRRVRGSATDARDSLIKEVSRDLLRSAFHLAFPACIKIQVQCMTDQDINKISLCLAASNISPSAST